jgi:hypothetical protein
MAGEEVEEVEDVLVDEEEIEACPWIEPDAEFILLEGA